MKFQTQTTAGHTVTLTVDGDGGFSWEGLPPRPGYNFLDYSEKKPWMDAQNTLEKEYYAATTADDSRV